MRNSQGGFTEIHSELGVQGQSSCRSAKCPRLLLLPQSGSSPASRIMSGSQRFIIRHSSDVFDRRIDRTGGRIFEARNWYVSVYNGTVGARRVIYYKTLLRRSERFANTSAPAKITHGPIVAKTPPATSDMPRASSPTTMIPKMTHHCLISAAGAAETGEVAILLDVHW
jgi:hypothetical protein